MINPHRGGGRGGYHSPRDFPCCPKTKKNVTKTTLKGKQIGSTGGGKPSKMAGKKIKSRNFEKKNDCMVFKLTVYIRNVISFSYNFGLYFTENRLF